MGVYDVLTDAIAQQGHDDKNSQVPGLERDDTISLLRTTNEIDLEQGDAEYAVTRLIERGYLYEVNEKLRITTVGEDEI
ncbi:hypothetical protein G6M89_15510 [Natronolimnobius sp. AArcel1]|uniref:hypothetical protein n=1 Tax=Natronolimnobius sp. AArcel1 TaxID=1679093 RepID=UPI0013EBE242|nr:hypothetical protein [Natronolimnobius sp. AArcel1]NGM70393.1 hypothetical protein [Natronolimnobius sp. AArcel1]